MVLPQTLTRLRHKPGQVSFDVIRAMCEAWLPAESGKGKLIDSWLSDGSLNSWMGAPSNQPQEDGDGGEGKQEGSALGCMLGKLATRGFAKESVQADSVDGSSPGFMESFCDGLSPAARQALLKALHAGGVEQGSDDLFEEEEHPAGAGQAHISRLRGLTAKASAARTWGEWKRAGQPSPAAVQRLRGATAKVRASSTRAWGAQ